MLLDLGYFVSGVPRSLREARQALARHNFEAALLDIKLADGPCIEIADLLLERRTAFAFISGYPSTLVPRHNEIPFLQ